MAPTKRNLSYERHVCVCCWLDEQCVTLRCWRVCLHDMGWWCVIFCFRASPTAVVANRTGGCLQSSLAGEVSKFPPLARARLCPLAPPSGFDWIRVCERHRGRFLLDYLYPSGVRRVWQGGTNIFCSQGPCAKSRYSEIRSHQEELNNKNGEAAKLICVVLGLDIFHRMNARTVSKFSPSHNQSIVISQVHFWMWTSPSSGYTASGL